MQITGERALVFSHTIRGCAISRRALSKSHHNDLNRVFFRFH